MSHPDPYDAIKVHKSKVLNASNQKIFINRQSGTILRDLFKKLKQGELDVKKVPDITYNTIQYLLLSPRGFSELIYFFIEQDGGES